MASLAPLMLFFILLAVAPDLALVVAGLAILGCIM